MSMHGVGRTIGVRYLNKYIPIFCLKKNFNPLKTISSIHFTYICKVSLERGYIQTCHCYHNLWAAIPKLHAKFHQNPWCGFGEKC